MAVEQQKRKGKVGLAVAIIIIVGAVGLLYLSTQGRMVLPYVSTGTSSTSAAASGQNSGSVQIVAQGRMFAVAVGSVKSFNFTVPQGGASESITGAYSSAPGKVEAAIITRAQYAGFARSPATISNAEYYYGDARSAVISTQLPPGEYSLVFYNPGGVTQNNVTVTSAITVR
jgi:hypothetical protein